MAELDAKTWQACSLAERLSTRTQNFFAAWYAHEHGWVPWPANNNLANISMPPNTNRLAVDTPWFWHVESVEPNDVAVYDTMEWGIISHLLFVAYAFPQVLSAPSDAEACAALNNPGRFGRWAPDPQYGDHILSVLQTLDAPTFPAHIAVEVNSVPNSTQKYTIERGDTLHSIAEKFNTTVAELATLNHLSEPYTLYAGRDLVV